MKGRNLDSRYCVLQWPNDCGIYAVRTRTNLFEIRFVVFQVKRADGWAGGHVSAGCWRSARAVGLETVSDMSECGTGTHRGTPTCSETHLAWCHLVYHKSYIQCQGI